MWTRCGAAWMLVCCGIVWAQPAFAQSAVPVQWTNIVQADTPGGNGLHKTAGCGGCSDAGANSTQTLTTGDGYLEFTAPDHLAELEIGYANDPAGTGYGNIHWAIHLLSGTAMVTENGQYAGEWAVADGDRFRISVSGGQVTYTHNGGSPITPHLLAPSYP